VIPRSHGWKGTIDAGWLIPFFTDEVLPGDTMKYRVSGFARLSTPIKPIMDNMYLDTFFFFVPLRLLWDNFERFMGAQDTPSSSTDYLIPQVGPLTSTELGSAAVGTIWDYFGLPLVSGSITPYLYVNAWFNRADALIYNEWFRDQNLQPKVAVPLGDGPDTPATYQLKRRGKRHDYITSALPWPQKGPAVSIPTLDVAGNATVLGDGFAPTFKASGGTPSGKIMRPTASAAASPIEMAAGSGNWTATQTIVWDNPHLIANLAGGLGTINQLRQAVAVQRLLEREARGGTRYTEWVKEVFDVTSPDARLQRPEYLGGSSTQVTVSPVAQTSRSETPSPTQTPQGNLAGMGTIAWSNHGFAKSFTEHGVLIGYLSVRADMTYQQNLDRKWTRRTKLDLYTPPLANLGEQTVLNQEVWFQNVPGSAAGQDQGVFGYQERYAEYRYKPSLVTGLFRSQVTTPLDVWHLAQKFVTLPVLGATFIVEDPPIDRVIAVPSEPHFIVDTYAEYVCARPMPLYAVPGQMDHF